MDPRIYIGIDNCFAIKRWTEPADWMRVVRELGMKYVEVVPDLEADPLLTPDDYRREWVDRVCEAKAKYGIETVMLYSNNATYDTIGFAHPDRRVRDRILDSWFERFCGLAAGIGADIGYFVHGLSEDILFDQKKRLDAQKNVMDCITRLNRIAERYGIEKTALEQMYTPHQPPFTIDTMTELMQRVKRLSGKPLYVTEDVGHHCPFYLRPDADALQSAFARYRTDGYIGVWLGSQHAIELFRAEKSDRLSADTLKAIEADMDANAGMFSTPRDNDCYEWLREIGCYSPIIHMQQTNGAASSHAGFNPQNNASGKIHPVKVLKAIAESYKKPEKEDMPPRVEDIYLIQEIYMSTKEVGYQGLWRIRESTDYLRRFIPQDGMRLSELLALAEAHGE